MRRLAPMYVLTLACGASVSDDPFNQTTDPTTSSDPTLDPGESSSSADESSTSDDPSTTMTTVDETAESSTDADTSGTTMSEPGVCGDGELAADEVCDGDMFGDNSCAALGFQLGNLLCNENCQGYSTENCYICGNGAIEQAEQCDGPLDDEITCASEGFTAGDISCNFETCQYDTSECSLCGDGVASGSEVCDGDDLGGMDCAAIGFEMGALACNAASCSYDFSGCSGGQYLQDFEGGAIPPEFSGSGAQMWIADMANPIAGTWSAASGTITHNQSSNLALSVTFAIAGTVEFTQEVSTEGCCDHLEFWVDGAMVDEWSGAGVATPESFPVAAGPHTLEWRYTKDGSVNTGSDRVWIDDIALTGGVPTG